MSKILLPIFDVVLMVLLMLGVWHYNHDPIFNVIFLLVYLLAMYRHYKGVREDEGYVQSIFALKESTGRIYVYDYLRVLAVLMVIVTHAVELDLVDGYIDQASLVNPYRILQVWTLNCNEIFVMLSGAFLLKFKEEPLSQFYKRRLSKVLIPMIVYYFFYVWITKGITEITVDSMGPVVLNFLVANIGSFPHFWFMYMIITLYIAIPFIRYMVKDMPYDKLTWLVVLTVVFSAIQGVIPALYGFKLSVSFEFASWMGIAIMGYWLTRPETARYYKHLIGLGLIALVILVALVYTREDYTAFLNNTSPLYMVMSTGIVAFFLAIKDVFKREVWIVRLISKYSYQIVMMHWWSLLWITRGRLGIHVNSMGGLGLVLSIVVTLAVSLVASMVIDYTITNAFTKLSP